MASTATSSSAAFFVVVNLLFFTLVTACAPSPPPPSPPPPPKVTPCPPPPKPSPPPPAPVYKPPCPPAPTTPTPTYPPTAPAKCPVDTLKFGVCAETLGGLINATAGAPPKTPCCPLIQGLVDLEAAVCLCTAIKASVLGINLNIPISLSLLVNFCGKSVPPGFQCP